VLAQLCDELLAVGVCDAHLRRGAHPMNVVHK
jgi:hypothetical protein